MLLSGSIIGRLMVGGRVIVPDTRRITLNLELRHLCVCVPGAGGSCSADKVTKFSISRQPVILIVMIRAMSATILCYDLCKCIHFWQKKV